jgi:GH24 family phage-related lysozyme (muramidase)
MSYVPDAIRKRVVVGLLSFSAAGLVGLAGHEYYTDDAVIPVKGDVPTYGFGMTHHPDGTPVKVGEKTTPPKALRETLDHIKTSETELKKCVTAPLFQEEYDELVDHSYQYGARVTCNSSMVSRANAGDYAGSCKAYLEYRYIHKGKPNEYDCSTTVNGQRNHVCWGVWERSKQHYDNCMAAQSK